jgi:hypothetical protein
MRFFTNGLLQKYKLIYSVQSLRDYPPQVLVVLDEVAQLSKLPLLKLALLSTQNAHEGPPTADPRLLKFLLELYSEALSVNDIETLAGTLTQCSNQNGQINHRMFFCFFQFGFYNK